MSGTILVDTDIIIDFLRRDPHAVAHFKSFSNELCVSAVTVTEIYAGVRGKGEEAEVEKLFSLFPVFSATYEIGREAGKLVRQYRSSRAVETADAIIAATCIVMDLELHTLNVKHFPMFKGLQPPYRKN
jgi:hypothetical protein